MIATSQQLSLPTFLQRIGIDPPLLSVIPDPSTSYLDLASCCHDLSVGPYSSEIFPHDAHKQPILQRLRAVYLLPWEVMSALPPNTSWGEHHFNQQTFLLLVAHIEGEF